MSESVQVSQLARIQGRPGQAAQLREALQMLEAQTRQEWGCLEFSFFQAISEPESFVLIERFRDAEALQDHLDAPYTQGFFGLGLVAAVKVQNL